MKVPAPTPDKKRKSSATTEREEGVNKLAKLDNKEQASDTEVPKEDQHTKPNPSGQVVQSPEMFQATLSKLSPSKQTMEAGGAAAQVTATPQQGLAETLAGMQTMLQTLIEGQAQTQQGQTDLRQEMHGSLTGVKSDLQEVADRVKVLEEGGHHAQVPLTREERHEKDLLAKIEHSRRCITVIGTGRDNISIKEIENLIQTNNLAERDEVDILNVSRLGGLKTTTPAFKVELATEGMATSLIERSRVLNARNPGESLVCKVYYPQEYSGRAREMKATQAGAFRNGLISQIYFDGTEMCLKVKERDSNLWMIYPHESGKFKPEMVMSATSKDNDSAEVKAARASLLAKLGVTEDKGKLIQPEVSTRSLIFSSRRYHLTMENYQKALPQIKKELVTTLEAVQPCNDWVQGEFQTRIVFKERADAKNALEACLKGFKTRPLEKGDFLTLELLWAW